MLRLLLAITIAALPMGKAFAAQHPPCGAVTRLMAQPERLAHTVSAERLLVCAGQVLVWETDYVGKDDELIPAHWTFHRIQRKTS